MAKSDKSGGERTYLGPAHFFKSGPDAQAVRPGEKVALSEDQYRQLTGLGHSFDPPWVDPDAVGGLPAPHEVPDLDPAAATAPAITAVGQQQQEVTIPA